MFKNCIPCPYSIFLSCIIILYESIGKFTMPDLVPEIGDNSVHATYILLLFSYLKYLVFTLLRSTNAWGQWQNRHLRCQAVVSLTT